MQNYWHLVRETLDKMSGVRIFQFRVFAILNLHERFAKLLKEFSCQYAFI